MKSFKVLLCMALAVAAGAFVCKAAPARADDDETYVAPLDEDGSDEAVREESGSGFDTSGSFYINEDDYDSGTNGDGTWSPDVPDASEPEEEGDGD